MNRAKRVGDRGESRTAAYLEARGYTILERQWRCRFGELDLVAQSPRGVLCFVEVKSRGANSIGLPREFVDERKRERLRKTAAAYLAVHESDVPARFDVAEITPEKDGGLRVVYLEDAFE